MQRWLAKVIALVVVFFVPFLCTILPIKVGDYVRSAKRGTLILNWLVCFGGGVFFATFVLHMGPEVREVLEDALIEPYGIEYPLPDLIIAGGFFIVLLIEKGAMIIHKRGEKSKKKRKALHVDTTDKPHAKKNGGSVTKVDEKEIALRLEPENSKNYELKHNNDLTKYHDHHHDTHAQEHAHDHHDEIEFEAGSRSLMLVIALSLSRIFEGLSIGLKFTTRSVFNMLIAVLAHEAVIAFTVGLQFVRTGITPRRIVLYALICSIFMPIGVGIGTFVVETGGNLNGTDLANGVLQAISAGAFLYVTFFEILADQFTHHDTSMGKVLALAIGFGVMAALAAIPEAHDEEIEDVTSLLNVTSSPYDVTTA